MAQAAKKEIPIYPFVSTAAKSKLALVFAYLEVVTGIVAIVFDWLDINLLNKAISGVEFSDAQINAHSEQQFAVAITQVVVALVAFIVFLTWYHRSYKNLGAMGGSPKTTPAWAVWDWFIPFINLFEPYRRLKEIWTQSVGAGGGWILFWWLLFLGSGAAGRASWKMMETAEYMEDFLVVDYVYVLSDFLSVAVVIFTIFFIKKVTEKQEEFREDQVRRGKMVA